jgi:hypothetical protein
VTKKFADTLERGAGGMGSAGNKVTQAINTFTGQAKQASQKVFTSMGDAADRVADWVKTPFSRRGGASEGSRLRQESGRVADGEGEEAAPAPSRRSSARAPPRTSVEEGGEEAAEGGQRQRTRLSAEERQAQQRAQAAKRQEERQVQAEARQAVRAARQSARLAPGMRREAFETPEEQVARNAAASRAAQGAQREESSD